jgi:dethiobiotin synthetase
VVNHILLTLEALPKNLRAAATVVLMTPPAADPATASNARLLRQLSVQNVHRLPWFGANFSAAAVLRQPHARQRLSVIVDSVI